MYTRGNLLLGGNNNFNFSLQVTAASDEASIRKVAMNYSSLLLECGLTLPLPLITLRDQNVILSTITLHHVLLKCKAEID